MGATTTSAASFRGRLRAVRSWLDLPGDLTYGMRQQLDGVCQLEDGVRETVRGRVSHVPPYCFEGSENLFEFFFNVHDVRK